MPSYTSQGTIRAKFSIEGADLKTKLFFDPAQDYSIKHRGESCAVFVSVEEGKSIYRRNQDQVGVEIAVIPPALALIAVMSGVPERHSKVEIQVDDDNGTTYGSPPSPYSLNDPSQRTVMLLGR